MREIFHQQLKAREDLEEEQIEFEIENFDAMSNKILEGVVCQ